jgi:hypothetical protein
MDNQVLSLGNLRRSVLDRLILINPLLFKATAPNNLLSMDFSAELGLMS